jgi:hypothetical protein
MHQDAPYFIIFEKIRGSAEKNRVGRESEPQVFFNMQ